eukprot:jgi/Mesvir1/28962/Mv17738-RA.1
MAGEEEGRSSGAARFGRRRGGAPAATTSETTEQEAVEAVQKEAPPQDNAQDDSGDENEASNRPSASGDDGGAASPPPATRSGWGADSEDAPAGTKSAVPHSQARRAARARGEGLGADKKGPDRRKHDQEEDVTDIPELEMEGEEDITKQVAQAPKMRKDRVQTIRELEHEMQYTLPSNADVNIDLSILAKVLIPPDELIEEDKLWEPETLLQEVASELNAEAETLEKDGKEGEAEYEFQQQSSGPDNRVFT